MRIAIVSPYALKVFGGVQNQVLGLAKALRATDQVTVLSPGRDASQDGVDFIGLGGVLDIPANGSRAPIALSPSSWTRTRRSLRILEPDVIHVHEPFVPTVGLAAATSGAAPVVATFHRGGAGRLYPLLGTVLRPTYERLESRVAVSREAAATLESVFGPHLRIPLVLPNAIDLDRFRTAPREPQSQPVVIFVGRHEHRKGLTVLLEAFSDELVGARLEIIGTGPESSRLRSKFSRPGTIDFLGALDDDAMATRVSNADLLVAPSLSGESFGVVLLEAMAAGTAVIASDLPGYRLAAGDAARFVPPGDARALREAMKVLLESPQARATLVTAGEARAADHSFAQLAASYRELFLSCCR